MPRGSHFSGVEHERGTRKAAAQKGRYKSATGTGIIPRRPGVGRLFAEVEREYLRSATLCLARFRVTSAKDMQIEVISNATSNLLPDKELGFIAKKSSGWVV